MKKCTYQASSDIALIKYWGKKNAENRLPENGSISMILDGLDTVTTVEFSSKLERDEIKLDGKELQPGKRQAARIIKHLDRIRAIGETDDKAKVTSKNNFPKSTGLSSSSSGFAALTLAAFGALELDLPKKEVSILARKASGSACRTVRGGFVEWYEGQSSETSYAESIAPAQHWDLRDLVTVVNIEKKDVSSTSGHELAQTSSFFKVRQESINGKLAKCREYIKNKQFTNLGKLVEAEALEFHSIIFTSTPPLVFWQPGTIAVMKKVQKLRDEGIECYFTFNTGFNIHVITLPEYEEIVIDHLKNLELVENIINAKVGTGPKEITEHLF